MTAPDYLGANREQWRLDAPRYATSAETAWASEPRWGIWHLPESEVHLLPDVEGRDVVELGCGTGYVSAWLARRGANVVGVDLTPEQLATAARMQEAFDLRFPLVRAAAEQAPLRSGSFDLAISEYGAAIWCDPYRWIPEAARLLRPGGELIFLGNSSLIMLFVPDSDEPADLVLKRPYFGMHRFEWTDDPGVEFHLGYGDWIRLFRRSGFVVEDLVELRAPEGAVSSYDFVEGEWARHWPSEQVWKLRKN